MYESENYNLYKPCVFPRNDCSSKEETDALIPLLFESSCTSTRSSEVSLSHSGFGTSMEVTVGMTSCSLSGCSAVYVLMPGIFLLSHAEEGKKKKGKDFKVKLMETCHRVCFTNALTMHNVSHTIFNC